MTNGHRLAQIFTDGSLFDGPFAGENLIDREQEKINPPFCIWTTLIEWAADPAARLRPGLFDWIPKTDVYAAHFVSGGGDFL